ncbi:hypothetical protein L3556_01240 [Candidatus Synechococcus calcipolaris G9]|uniref:phosphoribosylglycinamide formyltransferase 1 n=1 Tax=Candidatus Synechococcus calcipolaris G9 TaxID=1497997 RepID=A0ABT6EUM9_9SYNE|nr:formyltransferase family protein [Candidatus Synechococcus calcipolaris]MDG2989562.1 hypothetical protein [Candidatus Synechococcus calcipolaris G9]
MEGQEIIYFVFIETQDMRIGILASSGGSAFIETWKILCKYSSTKHDYFVFTDRECGIENFCRNNDIPYKRITYVDRKRFSIEANEYIYSIGGVDVIFLYFLRILTKDLFMKYPCLNIHPALLPAFKGINAVEQFIQSGAKFMGATLHLIDEGIDTGAIIAQIQTPMPHQTNLEKASKVSFLQKVYLTLIGIELLEKNYIAFANDFSSFEIIEALPYSLSANPILQNSNFVEGFLELQQHENTKIINS